MEKILQDVIVPLRSLLWDAKIGPFSILALLLVGTGIWFSFRTKFIQVRGFKKGMKMVFGDLFKKSDKNVDQGMSSFQALCTAVAAQVGTGSIVGASTAIAVGGPGAIFWMWVSAFFSMATIFVEATLAQEYKQVGSDGQVTGGPVYYIKVAFKGTFGKILAVIFALLVIIALGFMGNLVQSNGIASAWKVAFDVPEWFMGMIIAIISLFVFVGGMGRIASLTERLVPIMAVVYIVASFIVIIANFRNMPTAIHDIFVGAFNGPALVGGASGWVLTEALSKGVARGLFANEAGMGSTPHAHAVAKVNHPADQGYVAMIGVFIVTFVILNLTAFVVLSSRACYDGSTLTGAELAQAGFSSVFGRLGSAFVAIALTFFAFSTIIGWYFFGVSNWKYLFGEKTLKLYSIIVAICVFLGGYVLYKGVNVDTIWDTQDTLNGLMIIPNIIAIIALTKVAVSVLDDNIKKFGLN